MMMPQPTPQYGHTLLTERVVKPDLYRAPVAGVFLVEMQAETSSGDSIEKR
jgi:hypothetical protein